MIPVSSREAPALLLWALVAFSGVARAAEDPLPVTKEPQIVVDGRGFIGTPIETLAVSSTGDLIAAGADKVVRLWRKVASSRPGAPAWELAATLRGYQEPMGYETGKVHALCFSPDDRFLLVGVADNSLAGATRVFDLGDLRQMHGVIPGHLACTRGITFSPDGTHLATWSCDGQLIAYDWQAADGTARERFRAFYDLEGRDPEDRVIDLDLPPVFSFLDDDLLVFGRRGVPSLYSLRTGKVLSYAKTPARLKAAAKSLGETDFTILRGRAADTCTPFMATDKLQAAATGPWYATGGMVRDGAAEPVYYAAVLAAGERVPVVYTKHTVEPVAIACARQAPLVASSDMLGHIHLWDPTSGRQLEVIRPGARPIWSLAWESPARFAIGTRPYSQAEGYQFNHRGPATHLLDLEQMALTPVPAGDQARRGALGIAKGALVVSRRQPGLALSMKRDRSSGDDSSLVERFSLHVTDGGGPTVPLQYRSGYQSEGKWVEMEPVVPPNFQIPRDSLGSVSAYAFIDAPSQGGGGRCLIGTRSGELYECEIVADGHGGFAARAIREFLGHATLITSISLSPDGTRFATSSLDGTVRIWSLAPARVLADIPTQRASRDSCLGCGGGLNAFVAQTIYHRFDGLPFFERYRRILGGKYAPGEKIVVGSATLKLGENERFSIVMEDAEMTLEPSRDLAEPVMSFYFAADGEWVAWTPAGFYTASFAGADHVGFHVNGERHELAGFFPARTFATAFERPELVLATLRGRPPADAPGPAFPVATLAGDPRTTARPIATPEDAFIPPPTAMIVAPTAGSTLDAGAPCRVEIEVRSHPARPLRRLAVQIDQTASRLVSQRTSLETPRPDLTVERYETVLEGIPGATTLSAVATHDLGVSRSEPVHLTVRGGPGNTAEEPRLFVLAVGVGAYRDRDLRIASAAGDARGFAAAMERQRGGHFADVEVRTLIDDEASRDRIEDGLDWISQASTRSGDVTVMLLSGHGLVDDAGEWYFAPPEVDRRRVARTAVSRSDFERYLRPLRRLIVFTDTSRHAAAIGGGEPARDGARMVSPFRASGAPAFHACAMGNVSRAEDSQGMGVFAKSILDGLRQPDSDANRDGLVQLGELRAFVERRVNEATKGRQMPLFEAPATVGELVLGRYADR